MSKFIIKMCNQCFGMTIKEPDNNNGYAKASNIENTMFLQLTVLDIHACMYVCTYRQS